MVRKILAATAAVILCLPTLVEAAKVKVWHHHTPAHYDKARLHHVVISNEGAIRLARQLKPFANLDATHVWDVLEDGAGNLIVATGEEGKIFSVSPDGKVTLAYATNESQVLCLAAAPDGTIYAGTGPSGLMVRVPPQGKPEVLAKTGESYVWCLAVAGDGQEIYAGTGPHGRIITVSPDGKPHVFYQTKQEHILSLARGDHGYLYAGTDKDGLVYRIDPKGKGFVLTSTPQSEVRSLLVVGDDVYAGTSAPTRRRLGTPGSSSSSHASLSAAAGYSPMSLSSTQARTRTHADETGAASPPPVSSSAEEGSERRSSSQASRPPATGENSLFHISADGAVREIFRERALLLSLLRQEGRVLIGTGMEGQLFEVDEASRERSELARLDHGQIHCLYRRKDGSIIVGTGDPGKLYVLQDQFAAQGTLVSEVLDARLISKWGALRWHADLPAGTSLSLAVRTGNTPEPNETWSDWSAEQHDPERATIAAPSARFLQYRVTLATTDPHHSPTVHGLTLRYRNANQAPEVSKIEVPDLDAVNLDNPKKLKLKWTATDPNDDELTYSLLIRKEGWKSWVELEDQLDRSEFEWDTTTTPAGLYQVKVIASDRKDNAAEEALTGERVSATFAVAHEAPCVKLKTAGMDGEVAVIEATATDPLVRLTLATFSVDGKKWTNVFPSDGLFDSKTESFRFKTDSLKPGSHVVVLRVRDAAGNVGSGDVVFTVRQPAVPR